MRKSLFLLFTCLVSLLAILAGCNQNITTQNNQTQQEETTKTQPKKESKKESQNLNSTKITPTTEITKLEDGLSVVRYEGSYGFDEFLAQGGAKSDEEVAKYITEELSLSALGIIFGGNPFGCSTLSVKSSNGGYLFGRNFDWNTCDGLIVSSKPENGYASVSTVNMDFIQAGGINLSRLPDNIKAIIGLYAPLDGMNEKGLAVSVNMIQDSDTIEQDTKKPDITTTTAVRLLLDQAADVEEAVNLLSSYDLHASMGMMVHFAIADAKGNSVAVEYINNEISVKNTPIVTNFYLTDGEKYGIGTSQSHTRYEILTNTLEENETMTEADMRDALSDVSKKNFGEFESTEWSIIMNQETKELTYFHREDYEKSYTISVE